MGWNSEKNAPTKDGRRDLKENVGKREGKESRVFQRLRSQKFPGRERTWELLQNHLPSFRRVPPSQEPGAL